MNRRLNPDLFGPAAAPVETEESHYSAVATRQLQSSLKAANKRISHLESLIEVLQTQMSVMSLNNEKRTEAFSKALSALEQDFREQSLGSQRSKQRLEEMLREQRSKDGQMEAMIDRFNTSIAQFENRLATLQKVLSEKEMTLLTYRKIIEQIVDEVERLKRPPTSRPF